MAEHKHTKKARALLVRSGYKAGGSLSPKGDEAEDKRMIAAAVHKHESHDHPGTAKTKLKDGGLASGGAPHMRGDHKPRGGKHGKGHKTVVNVVVGRGAPDKEPVPVPVPVPGGGPAGGPPMPPPGAGPMAGPPGLPGQKNGGRSYKKGGKVKRAEGGSAFRDPVEALKPTGGTKLKAGGKAKFPVPMDAGSGGAKGRLEKVKDYGAKV